MANTISTITALFEAFGGTGAIAKVIGKAPSTASEMRRRDSIPVEYWPMLMASDVGKKIKLTSDDLMRLHVKRTSKSEVAA